MPRKVFVAGEILTAADVNTNLMDQSVMVFDDATARATAIPTPVEGMVTYLKDTDAVEKFDGSDFVPVAIEPDPPAILQVVSTNLTSVFTTSSNTFQVVTGLTAAITPSSTSSKILIFAQISYGGQNGTHAGSFKVTRGGTDIYRGDASDSRGQAVFGGFMESVMREHSFSGSIITEDSPATTTALTYRVEVQSGVSSTAVFVNRSALDTNNINALRGASSITLMEVAG